MKTRLAFAGVALIALMACSFHSIAAQSQERVIKRLPVEQNEPIEITDIKVNGQSVSFDKKFVADDEWLRSFVVSIKNRSDKLILFASIQLQFPRPPGSQDRMAIDDMSYGNWALQTRTPKPDELLAGMRPSEIVEIELSAQQFDDLRKFLTATNYPASIEKVDLRINRVIFQDDIMWTRGAQTRRDPTNASTWKNIDQ